MNPALFLNSHTPFALVPVVAFLATLIALDSFKLVRLRLIMGLVFVGAVTAGASYLVNTAVYEHFSGSLVQFSRYVSPFIEESLKSVMLVLLIRFRRVGLLVDAAITGFAVDLTCNS